MSSDSDLQNQIFGGVELSAWNDVDVTWSNPRFNQNPAYANDKGEMPVVFSVDMTNEDGDIREDQILSIGGGFNILDRGARIEHSNPKHNEASGFGKNSKAQVFLDSCLSVDADAMMSRYESVGVGPRDAAFWDGFTFHLVEIEKPPFKAGGKPIRQMTATEIIGWEGLAEAEPAPAPKPKPTAKKTASKPKPTKPVKAAEPEAPEAEVAADEGMDDASAAAAYQIAEEHYVILRDLALGAEDFDAFQTAAYEHDIIVEDGVQDAVDDEAGLFAAVTA